MIENPQYKEGAKKAARAAGSGIKRGASAAKDQTINIFAGSGGGGGNGGGGGKKKGVSDTLVKMVAVLSIIGGGGYLLYRFLQGEGDPDVPDGSIATDSVEITSETPVPEWWVGDKPPVSPGDYLSATIKFTSNHDKELTPVYKFGIRRTGHSPSWHEVNGSISVPAGETKTLAIRQQVPSKWIDNLGYLDCRVHIGMDGEDNDEVFKEDDMFIVSDLVGDMSGEPGALKRLTTVPAQSNIAVKVGSEVIFPIGYIFSGIETTFYLGALIRNDNCGFDSSCSEEFNVYIGITRGPDDIWAIYEDDLVFIWPEILSQHSEYDVFPYWSKTEPINAHVGDGTVGAGYRVEDVFKVSEDSLYISDITAEITNWTVEPSDRQVTGGQINVTVSARNTYEEAYNFICTVLLDGLSLTFTEKTFSGETTFDTLSFNMPNHDIDISVMISHVYNGVIHENDVSDVFTLVNTPSAPETKSFVGYVRQNGDTDPVVGATVKSTSYPPYEAITNDVGYFRIDDIEASGYTSYTFNITPSIADSHLEPIMGDIVTFPTDQDIVQRIYMMEDVFVPQDTIITGTVQTTDGSYPGNIHVFADKMDQYSGQFIERYDTWSDTVANGGEFEFFDVEPGTYRLRTVTADYIDRYTIGRLVNEGSTVNFDIDLEPLIVESGDMKVWVSGGYGYLQTDAMVLLIGPSTWNIWTEYGRTDSQGSILITDLIPGEYGVFARKDNIGTGETTVIVAVNEQAQVYIYIA